MDGLPVMMSLCAMDNVADFRPDAEGVNRTTRIWLPPAETANELREAVKSGSVDVTAVTFSAAVPIFDTVNA